MNPRDSTGGVYMVKVQKKAHILQCKYTKKILKNQIFLQKNAKIIKKICLYKIYISWQERKVR